MSRAFSPVKDEVRQFYDQVGWQLVGEDLYQNARYEDLRPVSREYIHRCHLRILRHLRPKGRFLLDAGSGPIQYPEYLEYSRGYLNRVCADISITALLEARKRLEAQYPEGQRNSQHGLFVVADIANLPFAEGVFDGVVTLHTIHHLPEQEHIEAYHELYRVLGSQRTAVIVNGWPNSPLMRLAEPFVRLANRLRHLTDRLSGVNKEGKQPRRKVKEAFSGQHSALSDQSSADSDQRGTFTNRHDVAWVKQEIGENMPLDIWVWRSVSVRFLRALIHPKLGGRYWLRLLYRLEEQFPHFFGEKGQYPLIVIIKQ
jgi:SAM-dependent methyltransferase